MLAPLSLRQVLIVGDANRTIHPFARTPRSPLSSMSTRLGNSRTRVGVVPFALTIANHITESPNIFANITHDERFEGSEQSNSPGVPDAINMFRPSSRLTAESTTVRPLSIGNPSVVENVEITATSSIFFRPNLE